MSFDKIKELFEVTMKSIKDFVPMENEDDKAIPKLSEVRSSKRDAEEELDQGRATTVDDHIPEQRMNVKALQTKYPIIGWEIYTEDTRKYWKIIRDGNHTEKDSVQQNLLVTKKEYYRLCDTCGVHHISTKKGMDIYMLVEKEYPLSRGILTQMLCEKLLVEGDSEMCRELIRKIFMQVERPRK
nr:hypothetical protein [Tanacetum cinerariifolium]